MICIILAAGIDTHLEDELQHDTTLRGIPRALLPVSGKPILDHWWDTLSECREITEIFVVTNAIKYKHFERWASAHGLPITNVINDGSTSKQTSLGAARDVELALRVISRSRNTQVTDDVMVLAGDSIFFRNFDLNQVIDSFASDRSSSLLLYYQTKPGDNLSKLGIIQVDEDSKRVTGFKEKPHHTDGLESALACPLFYIFNQAAVAALQAFVQQNASRSSKHLSCGKFLENAVNHVKFYGIRLPGSFGLVGHSHKAEYRAVDKDFSHCNLPKKVYAKTHARVGLMGNPSDGYYGKTISCTIQNFYAEVWLSLSDKLKIVPHPLFDPNEFGSINDLYKIACREGYHGGMRLLMGTCKKFFEFCTKSRIALPNRNFTIEYDTNIPRQVGLAGSSAIVTSLFKALMEFYGLTDNDIPKHLQPQFVLSVEVEEMGINAGLQDRVVQIYKGLVYMDFNKELLERNGFGLYENLDTSMLPEGFFLVYSPQPSDSGKLHSNVKQLWHEGDPVVVEAMKSFAQFAADARVVLEARNHDEFRSLMDQNFELRRKIFTDAAIGESNLQMVEIARSNGASCKFPGSGGAIVGLAKSVDDLQNLQLEFEAHGFVFCPLELE